MINKNLQQWYQSYEKKNKVTKLTKHVWSFDIYHPVDTDTWVVIGTFKRGEGQNFEHSNFRTAKISNSKINERSNVERPNL